MSAIEKVTGIIVPGMILVFIAAVIVLTTQKKCPKDKQGLVELTLNMMIVGIGAAFVFGWWCFKKIMQLTLGLIGIKTSSSKGTETLAAYYYKNSDEFDEWSCRKDGNSIILTGSGNLYYPK